MPGRELISKRTRNEFREALSGWGTLRSIEIAFDNEGFAPDLSHGIRCVERRPVSG